ncbi:Serine/threonine protein kinase [Planctomycetales bacterium 10988]|nr:Serine/threonine protein kinase [Planctomycetales bacterium 10988]
MSLLDGIKGWLSGKKLHINARFETLGTPIKGRAGEVRKVREKKTGEIYALKVLDPDFLKDYEDRFSEVECPSEIDVALHLSAKHPCLLKTYEQGITTTDQPYLIMEWFPGKSMRKIFEGEYLRARGHRLEIIRMLAEALDALHETGYLHRDVRPDNVLISEDMTKLKLIDYSHAVPAKREYVEPGNRLGFSDYLPPDSLRKNADPGPRLDIFAFGVTVYQWLTRNIPWPQTDTSTVARAFREAIDLREYVPNIDDTLASAVASCLEAKPQERPASLHEFLQRIQYVEKVEHPRPIPPPEEAVPEEVEEEEVKPDLEEAMLNAEMPHQDRIDAPEDALPEEEESEEISEEE